MPTLIVIPCLIIEVLRSLIKACVKSIRKDFQRSDQASRIEAMKNERIRKELESWRNQQ